MGTVTRIIADWLETNHRELPVAVIDPRGEGSVWKSIYHLPYAITQLIRLRFFGGYRILHLQVSERLSFLRKGILLGIGKATGMHVILHHHGAELIPYFLNASSLNRLIVRRLAQAADINIVLGEVWRQFLSATLQVPNRKIAIHVNAASDLKTNINGTDDPWHFLLIANLSARKGIDALLAAVAELKAKNCNVRLTLAGGGEIEVYKRMSQQLGIFEICTFLGWIEPDAVRRLLHEGGTLVLPSFHEGLPMSLLEALSAGVPIVTTPVGSIPEHFEHEVHCLFANPGDPIQLAQTLERAASDLGLRARLQSAGRQLYDAKFSVDAYMDQMLTLYNNISK